MFTPPPSSLTDLQTFYHWHVLGVRQPCANTIVPWINRAPAPRLASTATAARALPTVTLPPAATLNNSAVAPPDVSHIQSFEDLTLAVQQFDGCALKRGARNTVFTDGTFAAPLLCLGEAPGQDEDTQGKPFVGRAGKLLDAMLHAIGYHRHHSDVQYSVLIANTIFWRPPANRKPTADEMALCAPFVWRLIDLMQPKLILALGGTAASMLLETQQGIMSLRGKVTPFSRPHGVVPCLATLHPAYLLRMPAAKQQAWQDLLQAKVLIEENKNGTIIA